MLALTLSLAPQIACSSHVATGEQSARIINNSVKGTLALSTYIGGSEGDSIRDIATDSKGNIFITGGTASSDLAVTRGSFDTSFNGWHDVFVAKLDPSGSLVWSTFIGGPYYDRAYAIEVDSLGFVYVAGRAGAGFPVTQGVLQPAFAGDLDPNSAYGQQDGFITKLNPDGRNIAWSTYFGSEGRDFIRDCAIDQHGNIYLAATSVTRNHPHITAGAFQGVRRAMDVVAAKLTSDGKSVIWASYIGGSGDDGGGPSVRVDTAGNAYFLFDTRSSDVLTTTGSYQQTPAGAGDLVLAKFMANGTLAYSTYLGGPALDGSETHGLAVDGAGNAYVGFTTLSTTLPTTSGAFQRNYGGSGGRGAGRGSNYPGDVYVAKVSADGMRLLAATYLGGRHGEGAEGIAVDASGNVFLTGATYSDDFPITSGATQTGIRGGADLFVANLSADLSKLIYSSYLGGRNEDYGRAAAVDNKGNLYVAGMSNSRDWPMNGPMRSSYGGEVDGIFAKIILTESAESRAAQ